jgi:hypothetical protein
MILSGNYYYNIKYVSNEKMTLAAAIKLKFKNILQEFTKDFKCSADYDDNFIKNTIKSQQGD